MVGGRRATRTAPEERLVNLVVALMATEQGLTKQAILSSVAGYREHGEAGASKDALEKMFERDKENLRSLGIPVETIGDYADPDDCAKRATAFRRRNTNCPPTSTSRRRNSRC